MDISGGAFCPVITSIEKRRMPYETGEPNKLELIGYQPNYATDTMKILAINSTNDLIIKLIYLDRISLHIHLDYIRELRYCPEKKKLVGNGVTRAFYDGEGKPLFYCRKEGTYLKVHILARALDSKKDHKSQAIKILQNLYNWVGFIPMEKRAKIWDIELPEKFKNYTLPHFNSENEMFYFWLDQFKINCIEPSYILGKGKVPDYFLTDDLRHPRDKETGKYLECYYSDDYSVSKAGKKEKSSGTTYNMRVKNGLSEDLTKWEERLYHYRVAMDFNSLQGTAEDIHWRFQREIKNSMKMFKMKKGSYSLNTQFMEFYNNRNVIFGAPQKGKKKSKDRVGLEEFIRKILEKASPVSVRKMHSMVINHGLKGSRGTVHTVMKELGWTPK